MSVQYKYYKDALYKRIKGIVRALSTIASRPISKLSSFDPDCGWMMGNQPATARDENPSEYQI